MNLELRSGMEWIEVVTTTDLAGKHEGRVIRSMIFMQTSHPSHDTDARSIFLPIIPLLELSGRPHLDSHVDYDRYRDGMRHQPSTLHNPGSQPSP
jgi:hypothetical protein